MTDERDRGGAMWSGGRASTAPYHRAARHGRSATAATGGLPESRCLRIAGDSRGPPTLCVKCDARVTHIGSPGRGPISITRTPLRSYPHLLREVALSGVSSRKPAILESRVTNCRARECVASSEAVHSRRAVQSGGRRDGIAGICGDVGTVECASYRI